MRLREFALDTPEKEKQAIKQFIRWAIKHLELEVSELPKIVFCADQAAAQDQHRTGSYDMDTNTMTVYVRNRNMADILRTLAHELAHVKQHQMDAVHSNGPGSSPERSADQVAGYLMKIYGKRNPQIFQ